ncbi:MAG: class I SAM-dependent methyltransferase [Candidatus Woesearchaeota archaeon]
MNIKEIDNMTYSELVALTRERNRPSGGIRTINYVATYANIDKSKKILEIGCNTGFTSVNLALLTGCKAVGIDINEESIREAKRYASEQGVKKRTRFKVADALNLPFKDESFDIVWCSNVTSFLENKEKAILEYLRVLKTRGTLVAIPIYYSKKPPISLVEKISKVIGTKIEIWDKDFWINLFRSVSLKLNISLELYYDRDFIYLDRKKRLKDYVNYLINKDHLRNFHKKEILRKKLLEVFRLFNKNLQYCNFSILLFQKRKKQDEIELFLTKERW